MSAETTIRTDEELLAAHIDGDASAFQDLMARYKMTYYTSSFDL